MCSLCYIAVAIAFAIAIAIRSLLKQVVCSTSLPGGNQVDGLPPASSPSGQRILSKIRKEIEPKRNVRVLDKTNFPQA